MDIKKVRNDLRKGMTIYDMPLRVAYYARVSTDKDDQLNSLENQKHYFEDMIGENSSWKFVGGYIDEGISGTAVKKRVNFLKMIEKAKFGEIDLILTKEISRFSRNTVDSIKYTEYLLECGTIVYFLADNLNTIQEDAEFRLTIMASLAQDEVRKLSERVKFGINRMIKDRKLIGGNLTGYYKKNGTYLINEKEAFIIRYLFETYVSGNVSLRKIGEELGKMGYLNSKGDIYSQTTLAKFLTNPRYKGFYTARLSEVVDYKSHKKKKTDKSKQIIEKDDRIPAIVSEELWDRANTLYLKRKKSLSRHVLNNNDVLEHSKYTCKLMCMHCHQIYIRCSGGSRAQTPSWACKEYKRNGVKACRSPILKEKELDKIFIAIFNEFFDKKNNYLNQILSEYKTIISNVFELNNSSELDKQITAINMKKDKLLDLNLKGIINDLELKDRNDSFNIELSRLKKELKKISNATITNNISLKMKVIQESLFRKLEIENELPQLIKIFVDKVEITKIDNDRKHIKMNIYFNFNANFITKEVYL